MTVISRNINIALETCCNCGVIFGMSSEMKDELVRSGKSFYCPNGHSQHYTRRENLEKQIEELERKNRDLKASKDYWHDRNRENYEEAEHQKRRASTIKGHYTRLKNKSAKGECPCCSEKFENLETHMKEKHPDFVASSEEAK